MNSLIDIQIYVYTRITSRVLYFFFIVNHHKFEISICLQIKFIFVQLFSIAFWSLTSVEFIVYLDT